MGKSDAREATTTPSRRDGSTRSRPNGACFGWPTAIRPWWARRQPLVRRYAKAIRNYVGALIKDPQDADEVAHDVVVKLLRGPSSPPTRSAAGSATC